MKRLLCLFFLVPGIVFAADQVCYKDALFTAKLKKVVIREAMTETIAPADEAKGIPADVKIVEPEAAELALDLPFTVYGEKVMHNGQDITYSYRNRLDLEGQEVLVYLDYAVGDAAAVEKHKGCIGRDWDAVKVDPRVRAHYTTTKAQAFAVSTVDEKTKEEKIVPYDKADKDDLVPIYPGALGTKVEAFK